MAKKKTTRSTKENQIILNGSEEGEGKLAHIGGSQIDNFNDMVIKEAINALWLPQNGQSDLEKENIQGVIATMRGIAPKDEIEGMLAAQMCATHAASMECHRRAMLHNQTFEGRKLAMQYADKASRTFANLLDALNKHRGKGQQKVTVEHVHVHQGGQAIVGTVTQAGGGSATKTKEQPHAKQIADASNSPLRCKDAAGQPVPITDC